MVILGINAYHGDASAALVMDGRLVAAAEEERFTRIKHCAGFPANAVRYCLKAAAVTPQEITHIAMARDPNARWRQKALYALRMPRLALNRLAAMGKFAALKQQIAAAVDIDPEKLTAQMHRVEHHRAHLASSFFVSGFDQAALLSVDGLGDFASTMWGLGHGHELSIDGAIAFPHSLGIYYTAITQYLGFIHYGDEYKVMGLAALGEPEYQDEFAQILSAASMNLENGSRRRASNNGKALRFNLGLGYFIHHKSGPAMTWERGAPVLGPLYSDYLERRLGSARASDDPLSKHHENVAASLQAQLEQVMFALLNQLYRRHNVKRLCLSGGVALNCVVNGQIFEKTPFEEVYVPPAPGDAGLATGAAFYVWHQILGRPRSFEMAHAYWGPEFSETETGKALSARREEMERFANCGLRIAELTEAELIKLTAQRIADGKIVGWFQGRMEFGPRALGNRSIVVDPRRAEMKDILNSRIKRRETFRPFAPSILEERVADFFEESHPSPFMLMTYKVRSDKRQVIPAPTHVNGTARLQTVGKAQNPLYRELIAEFEKITGVPVLLNTSFNENEPVVCTPQEALDCFARTDMDVLAIGNYLVDKHGAGSTAKQGARRREQGAGREDD